MLENHHPAIISVDEFNKVQAKKKSNELVVVHKYGTVITYFKPKEGYDYYKKQKKGKKK